MPTKNPIQPWCLDDMIAALKTAFKFAYKMERQNKGEDIPYEGPELTANRILCTSYSIGENLKAGDDWNSMGYHEGNGREALDVLLMCAIQLGIEQGWRIISGEAIIAPNGEDTTIYYLREIYGKLLPESEQKHFHGWLDSLSLRLANPGGCKP